MAVPFNAFNFAAELSVPGVAELACGGAFAECEGLEMTLDVKTVKEGGNNAAQVRLPGAIGYGQLTLKRGMTDSPDLWSWMDAVSADLSLRADGEIVVFAADGESEHARFVLSRCLPLKLKAPPLNARDGIVAIEELQVAFESMSLKRPAGAGNA
jgi:phage tail-like protein